MKVAELRAALQERNLPTGGKKNELAARLQAALQAERGGQLGPPHPPSLPCLSTLS